MVLFETTLEGLPPTVNHSYRHVRNRTYKTTACKDYQDYVTIRLIMAYQGHEVFTNPVELYITFTSADRRRWDIDNRVKVLQDCLSRAGIIKDDKQVEKLVVERFYGKINQTKLLLKARN